ncbi:hypothetical protein HJG60_009703 [Phyllostomus discolor]|uniref:Uncharacterized protein n=1 Tax=Phyllostomus discolor TaxID=89673 RepID=A0A834B354_9CHIR|nr:hypothetical protein HJG60_009703 [Phyllostomus discolor]
MLQTPSQISSWMLLVLFPKGPTALVPAQEPELTPASTHVHREEPDLRTEVKATPDPEECPLVTETPLRTTLDLKSTPTSIPAEALEWGPSCVEPPEGDPNLTHDPPALPGEMAPAGDEELGLDPPVLSRELAQENLLRPALKPPI